MPKDITIFHPRQTDDPIQLLQQHRLRQQIVATINQAIPALTAYLKQPFTTFSKPKQSQLLTVIANQVVEIVNERLAEWTIFFQQNQVLQWQILQTNQAGELSDSIYIATKNWLNHQQLLSYQAYQTKIKQQTKFYQHISFPNPTQYVPATEIDIFHVLHMYEKEMLKILHRRPEPIPHIQKG